jgi:hypothetical protein
MNYRHFSFQMDWTVKHIASVISFKGLNEGPGRTAIILWRSSCGSRSRELKGDNEWYFYFI